MNIDADAIVPTTGRVADETQTEEDGWDRLGQFVDRVLPAELHVRLLWLLLIVSFGLRMIWLDRPPGALIFDEKYYVNAARVIAKVPPMEDTYQDKPLGLDPNTEHPPLAKLLVAGSIRLLGDNAFGWRIPSVVFGTVSVLLMYRIGRRVAVNPYVGLVAAALLSFDNLFFVHSRIFTLDIFMLAFMLLGLDLYLSGRASRAGVAFALAALSKVPGVFGLFAVAVCEVLRFYRLPPSSIGARHVIRPLLRVTVSFAVALLLTLGVMDRLWVGYSQPFEHLQHIFSYGQILRRQAPSGIESFPWQWLWNDVQIPYIKVEQQVKVGDEIRENRPIVLFLGAMNPFVLALWPFALAFVAHLWWSRRPGANLGAVALAWFGMTYAPFITASVFGQRISYLFYFLPSLPAIALAGAYFLLSSGLPRSVIWTYLVAVLLGFYGYFPFKPIP